MLNASRNEKLVQIPYSLQAEKALLANILIDNGVINEALRKISSEDFYDSACRNVFKAMEKLESENKEIDVISLEHILPQDGFNYIALLNGLYELPGGYINSNSHIRLVKERALERRTLNALDDIKAKLSRSNSPETVIYETEANLSKLIEDENKSEIYKLDALVNDYINRDTKITGIPTGFSYLDELTTGFQSSNFIVIAARPSIGKTALALKMALNMATAGKKVVFFTIEMSKEQIAERALSMLGRINSKALRKNKVPKNSLSDALQRIKNLGIYINDDSAINIVELKAKIKQLKKKQEIDIAFVDYLQLIKPLKSNMTREQAISEISRGLKAIAKDLALPIVALAQLNRLVETRENKKPHLADLRESGSIEQDADVVILIHRPGFYEKDKNDNSAQLIIAKHRNGATDVANLTFTKEFTLFEEEGYV